jgi:hypothetical protein
MMRELCAFHALPIVIFRAAEQLGERFTYCGVIYDPRDTSYWGA